MIDHIVSVLQKEFIKLYKNKFIKLILYGSYVHNQQKEDSDIDLLLVIDECINQTIEINRISEIVYEQTIEHEILISVLPVSKIEFENSKMSLYENIRIEGIIVE